jgi:hypothetical protein
MTTVAPPTSGKKRYPGRFYIGLAFLTTLLGLLLYGFQFYNSLLTTSWYAPILATLGFGLAVLSLSFARTIWRMAIVVFLGLFAGLEWYILLVLSVLAPYQGPVKDGAKFPAFHTKLSDGTLYTQKDLTGTKDTVLVVFRGHW